MHPMFCPNATHDLVMVLKLGDFSTKLVATNMPVCFGLRNSESVYTSGAVLDHLAMHVEEPVCLKRAKASKS